MSTAISKMSKSSIIKAILTLIIPLSIFLIPTGEVFTSAFRLFCVFTLMAILTFAFENVNQTTVAILLPVCYIFFNVAPANVVMSPWLSYIPWMTLSGLVMAAVLQSTGLLQRVAYFCILKTGASYKGIIFGLGISACLMQMFVGDVVIPMAALSYGICLALNTGKRPASAAIMLSAAMGCLITNMFKFTSPIIKIGIGESVTGPVALLGFFESWWINLPTILYLIIMLFITSILFKPDTHIEGKEFFKTKLAECGKMSKNEWKATIIILFYLTFILTNKYFPYFSLNWGLAFVPMLMAVPGIGAAKTEDMKKLNFGFILFVTACMSIGSVAGSLGVGPVVVKMIMPLLAGKSYYMFFVIVWFGLVALNFVMTPLAMMAAFTIPLVTIAMDMGINPLALYYLMGHGCEQIIMPYEYALYMISFAFGLIRMNDFMKLFAIKMVVNCVIVFAVLIPWWNFLGFIYA